MIGTFGVIFRDRLPCDPEGIDPRRDAAVHRDLQQDLLDFRAAKPIAQRPLYVKGKLVGPIERADHAKIEQAAITVRQARTRPDVAPAIGGGKLLHRT